MKKHWLKDSIGIRLAIIAFLTLILLIPAAMIQSLIRERQDRRDGAISEVSEKWGKSQVISGPVLSIPYRYYFKNDRNETLTAIRYAHFLPEDLNAESTMKPEIRYRGIYEIVLYNAVVHLQGNFSALDFSDLKISSEDILWNDAFLSIGITDMKGIKDLITVQWNENSYAANPGIQTNDVLESGISTPVKLVSTGGANKFSLEININGSSGLFLTPVGKETKVKIQSEWKDPSFLGQFLPEDHTITENGFTADYKILHLNRNYPQQWIGDRYKIQASAFGVNLLLPVDEYQKTMRTAKYAVMFISLTFLTFFMIDLLNKKVLHPIQYLLIGFALLVFYTLLLSFSEHIVFKYAYLLAGVAIIGLITAYTKSVLKSNLQTSIIAGVLVLLYGYLYIVLQLQDFALLMGSIGLFIILATVMFLTRKIDWFSVMKGNEESETADSV